MNCNKCGTPILPGENTCRFCGATGEFSVRKAKPEIISFDDINDNYERINFSLGEDEVSITPVSSEEKPQPVVIDLNTPVVSEPVVVVSEPTVIEQPTVVAVEPVMPVVEPTVASVVEQPVVYTTPVTPEVIEEVVGTSVVEETVKEVEVPVVESTPVAEEVKIPVVNSVIDEPPTAKIPVEEVKALVEAEKEAEVIEEVVETPVVEETKTEEKPKEEEKKETKEVKETKPTNYKVFCVVLALFLLVSIVLNCILLFNASGDSSVVKASESSLMNLKTVYGNYKFSLPYSWVVNSDNQDYLLIHNDSESWAASISLTKELDYDLVKEKADKIVDKFSLDEYTFTSNYVKTVNSKEFHLFKGKYASHTVYLVINKIDNETVAVTDVKFKGEVDDEIIEDILKCLGNATRVDMSKFSENDFEFENVNPLLEGIIKKVEEE